MPRAVPEYRRFRPIFVGIISVVWFVLLWGLGYLVAAQLPGEGPLPFRFAWRFFLVGFSAVFFFGGTATFVGFLQQHLGGLFTLPESSIGSPQSTSSINPWSLGLSRLGLFWLPAVAAATLLLWMTFPDGIGRGTMAFVLAALGALLAGTMAAAASGKPFLQEIRLSPAQRTWHASFFSYLFWRHGVPWGIGNGVISAVLALAVFPRAPDGEYTSMPISAVSMDIFVTSLVLCFFMALSAHPQAWVDARLGVISAPAHARSPARGGRIAWFVGASAVIAVGLLVAMTAIGSSGFAVWGFAYWKGVATTVIAGASAMATAYWTLAREKASQPVFVTPDR